MKIELSSSEIKALHRANKNLFNYAKGVDPEAIEVLEKLVKLFPISLVVESYCSACGIEIEHKGKCEVCHCKGLEAYEA